MCSVFPAFSPTLTIRKLRHQKTACTQFHEPINTAFTLITIFSFLEKCTGVIRKMFIMARLLSDGSKFLANHELNIPKWGPAITWGNRVRCSQIVSQMFYLQHLATGKVSPLCSFIFAIYPAKQDDNIFGSTPNAQLNLLFVKTILWVCILTVTGGSRLA